MDEDPFLYQYIILAFLLVCSAFFSGTETAIFSLNRLERNSLLKTRPKGLREKLTFLLGHQDQILITILTGNMVVNIFASGIGEAIGARLFGSETRVLSIAAMTLLLLLAGELTPKRFAVNHPQGFTRFAAYPLSYVHFAFSPVRIILNWITGRILGLYRGSQTDRGEPKHALVLSTAELGFNQQILKRSEYKLFKSYLQFKEKQARNVMTPRSELKTVSYNTSIGQVLNILREDPEYLVNSFLILHESDVDHLSGWVYIPDILQFKFKEDGKDARISTLAREFHAVPDSKSLTDLILEMRENEREVVLLVDEYGGTAGILWFRNIIEDVLKAFYAPFKENFSDIEDTSVTIPGSMSIEEFQEFFSCKVDTDAETVAGLFFDLYGDIPLIGAAVHCCRFELRVLSLEAHKIKELRVTGLGDGETS